MEKRTTGIQLGDKYIENLAPTNKTLEISDRSRSKDKRLRRGLILRVTPTGKKVFIYRHKVAGKTRKLKLGDYPAVGLAEARALYDGIRDMSVPELPKSSDTSGEAAREGMTVRRLCRRFVEEHSLKHKRSWKTDHNLVENVIIPAIGDIDAGLLTSEQVDDMVNQILVNGTPRQAEKALVVVRTAYNWALGNMRRKKQVRAKSAITSTVTQTRIIDPRLNPCDGIVIPEYEPRTYHLEGEALQEFLEDIDTLPAPYSDILMLQLMTVTRVGEVAGMHADEIDMKKQIWTIPAARTKNARTHKVMLSDQAMAIIKKYLDENTGYLFPFKAGHVTSDKVGHVIAGWKNRPHSDFTSHSLRHTGTTWLADNEAPLEIRDRITNHVPQNMDARYNHASYNRQAKEWLQKYSDFLENSG